MKHYIGTIFERHGEYEYESHIIITETHQDAAARRLEKIASEWYGDAVEDDPDDWSCDREKSADGEGWFFNCGEVYVEARKVWEISATTYEEMSNILTEM